MTERTVMTVDEIEALFEREFPQLHHGARTYHIEAVGPRFSRLRMAYADRYLRPGGTISGPSMMALADLALYVAILANVGPVALAVTVNLTFNFLRKPEPRGLLGECRLIKLGRRLAVGEVDIRSEGAAEPCCHAIGTYSLPG